MKGILVSTHRAGRKTMKLPIGKTRVFRGEITVETSLPPPPEIVLVSPIEGTITTSGTVAMAGTVTGEEPLGVTVSGTPVNLVDGAFSTSVTLDEGVRVIEVTGTDGRGRTVTVTRTVTQDSITPTLSIIEPPAGAILVTATPGFVLVFDDPPGSGIDPASFRAVVVGLDQTAEFSVDESGASGSPSTPLEDGQDLLASFTIADRAGHTTTASVTITVDTESPVLTLDPADGSIVTVSRPTLEVAFDDGPAGSGAVPASLILQLDGLNLTSQAIIGASSARVEIEDPLDESEHVFEATMADQAGHVTTAASTFRVDTLVPVVLVTAPVPGSVIAESRPTLAIVYDDAGSGVVPQTLAVSIDGTEITTQFVPGPTGAFGTLPAGVELDDGEHQVLAGVTDAGGLTGFGLGAFTVDTTAPVFASIHPPAGSFLGSTPVRISGVILDLSPVEVEVNGVPAVMSGSGFTLDALDLSEGPSLVELTAVDGAGNQSSVTHALVIDTQVPVVTLVNPSPGGALQNRSVDLVIQVEDQTTTNLVVQGGGVSVSREIAPGSPAVTIPVELPADTTTSYTFYATDAAGNLSPVQSVELTHDGTPPDPPILFTRSIVTSNTRVGIDGCAEPGSTVEFLGGLGATTTVAEEPMGKFSLDFDLPPDTTLTVRVRVIDAAGNASAANEVKITQYTGTPPATVSSLVAVGGFAQQGLAGEALHQPLTVLVRSLDGLPLAGQDVLFRVMAGRMTLNGPVVTQVTVRTDATGRAQVTGFLAEDASDGDEPGDALVVATRPGPAGIPAVFDIAALPLRPEQPTQLSGYLEDSQGRAIPGVDVHLHTPPFLTTVTDQRGHFRFEDIPPGEHHFLLDGSTANLPGTYTNLVFALNCLAGQDNSLGMPIFLPKVDVSSGIDVSETQGGVLTNPKLPGLEIRVDPGSATFPDGSRSGRLAVVAVPGDKTPMPFPEGLYGNFVIAVYPPGTHFDPPARTVFPNLDPRLSPGDTTPIISFDHDVGDYVKVGTATVSPDGSRIISDPGYGIKVAAWHVTPPPDPPEYGCVRGRLTGPPGSCIVESECWTVNNRRLVNPVLGDLPPGGVRVEICNVPNDQLAGAKLECRATSIRVTGPRQLVLDPLGGDDQASTTSIANRVYQVSSSDDRFQSIRLEPEEDGVLTVTPSTVLGSSPVTFQAQRGAGRFRVRLVSSNGVRCDTVKVLVVPKILDLIRSTLAQGGFSAIRPDSLPLVLTQGGEVYFERDLNPENTGLIKGTVFSTDAGGFKLKFSSVETPLDLVFFVTQAQPPGIAAGVIHPDDVSQTLEPGVDTLTVRFGDVIEDLTEPAIVQVRVPDDPQGLGATLGYVVVSPPRIATAGDSITAGFQAGFLANPRQANSYPSILQRLTRLNNIDRVEFLPHPLIGPGEASDKNGNPLPVWIRYQGVQPDPGQGVELGLVKARDFPEENVINAPRTNPTVQPFNLAVPGYNTGQTRDISAAENSGFLNSPVSKILYEDILGEQNPTFRKLSSASTQLDQIRTVAPSMLVLWAGNNDFLGAVTETTTSPPNGITPPEVLYPVYTDLVDRGRKITPDVILATVPDATSFPTFIPLTGDPVGEGYFGYQISGAGFDFTRIFETTALPLISQDGLDLTGCATSLGKYIQAQWRFFLGQERPIRLRDPVSPNDPKKGAIDPGEIAFIRDSIARFNQVVLQVAVEQDLPVVRMDLLLDRLGSQPCRVITNVGEILPGLKGRLFSPDGIHATDLGYGLLAHAFRHGINGRIANRGSFGGLTHASQRHGPLPSTITVPAGCLE